MSQKKHMVLVDPIAFAGGSKVATENILRQLNFDKTRVSVLTADQSSWHLPEIEHQTLFEPDFLVKKEQGVGYFLRHLNIALQLFLLRMRHGPIDIALGASGPGVDLATYLVRPLLKFKVIQLIHGPVAASRTIAKCLLQASQVHYLETTASSITSALARVDQGSKELIPPKYHLLRNGLLPEKWPSQCQYETPVVFWAASLLKWKGLDTFTAALRQIPDTERPKTHICYIEPKNTNLEVSQYSSVIYGVRWHRDPDHLDLLRSESNIFVSTSKQEPFGLSILEAMAAGHCVVIPKDGAFWDRTLIDGVNCIKYEPGNAYDLAKKIIRLKRNLLMIRTLGESAKQLARSYRADICYVPIKHAIEAPNLTSTTDTSQPVNNGAES